MATKCSPMIITTLPEKFSLKVLFNRNNNHPLILILSNTQSVCIWLLYSDGFLSSLILGNHRLLLDRWEELITTSGLLWKRNIKVHGCLSPWVLNISCFMDIFDHFEAMDLISRTMYICTHLNHLPTMPGGFMALWSSSKGSQTWVKNTCFQSSFPICHSIALTTQGDHYPQDMRTTFIRKRHCVTVKASRLVENAICSHMTEQKKP